MLFFKVLIFYIKKAFISKFMRAKTFEIKRGSNSYKDGSYYYDLIFYYNDRKRTIFSIYQNDFLAPYRPDEQVLTDKAFNEATALRDKLMKMTEQEKDNYFFKYENKDLIKKIEDF